MRTTYSKNRRGGHSPGHVRDAFLAALEAYLNWEDGDPEPTVEFEPREITISKAAGLVWNCSDTLPGWAMDDIADTDLEGLVKRGTYASAARAMLERIGERRGEMVAA